MALSPVRSSLIAGKGWECGRDKLCVGLGEMLEQSKNGMIWAGLLDMLTDVTANPSKIVVEGGGQDPCPVSEGKLHKTCQGEELAVVFRAW